MPNDWFARSAPAGGSGLSLGRPFGVPVFVSPSWLVLAALITVSYADTADANGDLGSRRYLVSAGFALLIFFSIFCHELGHCVVSRRLGLPVRRLTLFLLGGVSEIEREPETPLRELLVAGIGPVVSLVLGGLSIGLLRLVPAGGIAHRFAFVSALSNIVVGIFNLLPGLPLDGGRILRAGVWRIAGSKLTGSRVAAYAGYGIAVLVLLYGLWNLVRAASRGPASGGALANLLFLALIAAFIAGGATQALRSAQLTNRLPGLTVRSLVRRALPVAADVPVAEALRRAHEVGAYGLVVVDSGGRPHGVVSEAAVVATPDQRRPWVSVGALARTLDPGLVLDADLEGAAVLEAMRRTPASEYLVREPTGGILGVLAAADVARALDPAGADAR